MEKVIIVIDEKITDRSKRMTAEQAKHEQEKYCELHPEYKTAYNMIYV